MDPRMFEEAFKILRALVVIAILAAAGIGLLIAQWI